MPEPLDLEPLYKLAAFHQRLVRQLLVLYTQEVDAIVRSRCTDARRIEQQLDHLLGVCFDPDILLLVKKLCRHYYRIDPKATADYVRFYREMHGQDDQESAETEAAPKQDG